MPLTKESLKQLAAKYQKDFPFMSLLETYADRYENIGAFSLSSEQRNRIIKTLISNKAYLDFIRNVIRENPEIVSRFKDDFPTVKLAVKKFAYWLTVLSTQEAYGFIVLCLPAILNWKVQQRSTLIYNIFSSPMTGKSSMGMYISEVFNKAVAEYIRAHALNLGGMN